MSRKAVRSSRVALCALKTISCRSRFLSCKEQSNVQCVQVQGCKQRKMQLLATRPHPPAGIFTEFAHKSNSHTERHRGEQAEYDTAHAEAESHIKLILIENLKTEEVAQEVAELHDAHWQDVESGDGTLANESARAVTGTTFKGRLLLFMSTGW